MGPGGDDDDGEGAGVDDDDNGDHDDDGDDCYPALSTAAMFPHCSSLPPPRQSHNPQCSSSKPLTISHNQLQKSHNLSQPSSAELSWSPLSDGDRALCDQQWPPCTVRAHATNAQLRVPRSSTRGAARVSLVWSPPLFWSGLLCFALVIYDLFAVCFERARPHFWVLQGDPTNCQALPQTRCS